MDVVDIMYYGDNAKNRLKEGVNKLAEAVKVTMGPAGKTVLLGDTNGNPVITKDGVSVANYIRLIDPVENMGAQLLKQVASKTVKDAGDGTTTSIVLAQAIINNDSCLSNATKYRYYLEKYRDLTLKLLEKESKKIKLEDVSTLNSIAYTSSNSDKDIAEIVVKAFQAVGVDGLINVVSTSENKTKLSVDAGYRLNRGYLSSYFINVPDKGVCNLEKCYVIILKDKLEDFKAVAPILRSARAENLGLVIIAKEYGDDFLTNCAKNFSMGNHMVPLLADDYNNDMIFNLEDLAIYTETTVITQAQLRAGTDIRVGVLNKISVSKDYTTINSDISVSSTLVRVKQLQNLLKEAHNEHDRAKIKSRIARLTTGVATIKVGGYTEGEIKERFDRYEDAVGAVLSAVRDGILPGGGVALYRISKLLKDHVGTDEEESAVVDNLMKSLCAPYFQILKNADISNVALKSKEFFYGYDITKNKEVDFLKAGIIDPYLVTSSALINAISVSAMIITTGAVLQDPSIYA